MAQRVLKLPLKYKWDSAKNGASKIHRYAQSKSGPQTKFESEQIFLKSTDVTQY